MAKLKRTSWAACDSNVIDPNASDANATANANANATGANVFGRDRDVRGRSGMFGNVEMRCR